MNKFLIVLLTLLFNIQQANAFNVDAFMDKNVAPVSDAIAKIIFILFMFLVQMYLLLFSGFYLRVYSLRSI